MSVSNNIHEEVCRIHQLGRRKACPRTGIAGPIFLVPGRPEPVAGPAGYHTITGMMRAGFPDIQWTLQELISEGDKLAARFTMRGTHRGQFMGVSPTGKQITVQALNIYHLTKGQIIKEYGSPDMLGLLAQIGGLPV